MKRKLISTLLCMGLLASTLAGCGKSNVQSNKAVEVTAMMMQSRYQDGLKGMIDKLKAEENITIDLQVIPDDQYSNLLKMKLSAGEAPDMVDYNVGQLEGLVDVPEYFTDLSGEKWIDKLVAPENSKALDGNHYGFPFKSMNGFLCISYNKDVFAKVGVEVPKTPQEFDKVCEKLNAAGITPLLLPADSWVPQIWMTSNFSRAMGTNQACQEMADKIFTNKAKLTDYPQLAEAFDYYLDLFKKGYINKDYLTVTYDSCIEQLAAGKGAMIMNGDWVPGAATKAFPDSKIGVFNVPVEFDSKDLLSVAPASPGFYLNKKSENKEAVKKIFDLWSTPKYEDLFFANTPGFPAFEGINGGAVNEEVNALFKKHTAEGSIIKEMNIFWAPIESLQGSTLWIYYQEAPSKGNMDGKQLMKRFQGDIDTFMKAEGVKGF